MLDDCDPFLRWQVLSARTPVLERAPASLGLYREKTMAVHVIVSRDLRPPKGMSDAFIVLAEVVRPAAP